MNVLIFQAAPKVFDEDVIPPSPLAVYRDFNSMAFENGRKIRGCERAYFLGASLALSN